MRTPLDGRSSSRRDEIERRGHPDAPVRCHCSGQRRQSGAGDVYPRGEAGVATIGAIRLESLPHPSLPRGGSGRDFSGAFVLNEFTINMAPPGALPAQDSLPFRCAAARRVFIAPARSVPTPGTTGSNAPSWPTLNVLGRMARVYRRQEAVFELSRIRMRWPHRHWLFN